MNNYYPATDDDITTDAPVRLRVGHELEFQNPNGASPIHEMRILQADGVATPAVDGGDLHQYRCRCHLRDDYPLHPTSDAGVEWIIGGSSGVLYGSDAYYEAIDTLCRYANLHNFGPYSDFGAGGHVHVTANRDDYLKVCRGYSRFFEDLKKLTRGDFAELRRCQQNYQDDQVTNIIRKKPYGTFEFRQWNGSRIPETIHVSAAVSVGIVSTVADGRDHNDFNNLFDWIAPYLSDNMQEVVDRRLSPAWNPVTELYGRDNGLRKLVAVS